MEVTSLYTGNPSEFVDLLRASKLQKILAMVDLAEVCVFCKEFVIYCVLMPLTCALFVKQTFLGYMTGHTLTLK